MNPVQGCKGTLLKALNKVRKNYNEALQGLSFLSIQKSAESVLILKYIRKVDFHEHFNNVSADWWNEA